MSIEIFRYVVIISVSGVLSLILAAYAFIHRKVFSSSTVFILMSVFSVIYIFGHAFELASFNLLGILFWVKVQYFGMPYIAPLSLLLAIQFTGRERFNRVRSYIPLFIIPVITTILSATNEWHRLFYREVFLRPNEVQPLIDVVAGPWYIVHGSFTFGCLIASAFVLLWYWVKSSGHYWKQIATMLTGVLLPALASFLYLIGLSPYGMDPVPIVMCFTSALYLWAILSTKLFDLTPIARERIFENMRDGVLVVDAAGRLVDYNAVAAKLLSISGHSTVGATIRAVWETSGMGFFPYSVQQLAELQEVEWIHEQSDDYFLLRCTPILNRKGVAGYIVHIADVTKQKRLEHRLAHLAFTDGLTKIFNRMHFIDKCEEALAEAVNTQQPLALFMFDIDHFKKINDCFGHAAGDEAILHVVEIGKRLLTPNSLFGRYGGEEFVVCMPNTPILAAIGMAEKIRAEIERRPLQYGEIAIPITASFGVAACSADTAIGETVDSLLREADRALYVSKENGRNKVFA